MTTNAVPLSFVGAMRSFFGLLPGQQLSGFAAELKALSMKEKQEFHEMLLGQGVKCEPPMDVSKKT